MTSNRPPAFLAGEHLALDFLNTSASPGEVRIEMLGDGNDLVDWLVLAGEIEASAAARGRESERGRNTHPRSVALRTPFTSPAGCRTETRQAEYRDHVRWHPGCRLGKILAKSDLG
jgi:hypothetical protein